MRAIWVSRSIWTCSQMKCQWQWQHYGQIDHRSVNVRSRVTGNTNIEPAADAAVTCHHATARCQCGAAGARCPNRRAQRRSTPYRRCSDRALSCAHARRLLYLIKCVPPPCAHAAARPNGCARGRAGASMGVIRAVSRVGTEINRACTPPSPASVA
jgi:hypothetical protein